MHILSDHWRELKLAGKDATPATVEMVAAFVSRILTRKARIHCEFADTKGSHRPLVVKSTIGMAVLEPRRDVGTGDPYYSVVTAYQGANATGPQIGTL